MCTNNTTAVGKNANITLTLITAQKPAHLSKRFNLVNNKLVKIAGGKLKRGIGEKISLETINDFAELLKVLKPNQAITYGVTNAPKVIIIPEDDIKKENLKKTTYPILARTRANFNWSSDAGILMVDYDPPAGEKPLTREELIEVLLKILPALIHSPFIWRPSVSSCIKSAATGEMLRGISGQRIYIPIKIGKDTPRSGNVLFKRLWLAGFGRIEISKDGKLLKRTIIDGSVYKPEGLDFAGGASLGHGVIQELPDPIVYNPMGEFLDTEKELLDLTDEENATYAELVAKAKAEISGQQEIVQKKWIEEQVKKELEKCEIKDEQEKEKIEKKYKSITETYVLPHSFQIRIKEKSGERNITIGELLKNKTKYNKVLCQDPLEPDYNGGQFLAYVNLSNNQPNIYSHAHGGVRYILAENNFIIGDPLHLTDGWTDSNGYVLTVRELLKYPVGHKEKIDNDIVIERTKTGIIYKDYKLNIQRKYSIKDKILCENLANKLLWAFGHRADLSKIDKLKDFILGSESSYKFLIDFSIKLEFPEGGEIKFINSEGKNTIRAGDVIDELLLIIESMIEKQSLRSIPGVEYKRFFSVNEIKEEIESKNPQEKCVFFIKAYCGAGKTQGIIRPLIERGEKIFNRQILINPYRSLVENTANACEVYSYRSSQISRSVDLTVATCVNSIENPKIIDKTRNRDLFVIDEYSKIMRGTLFNPKGTLKEKAPSVTDTFFEGIKTAQHVIAADADLDMLDIENSILAFNHYGIKHQIFVYELVKKPKPRDVVIISERQMYKKIIDQGEILASLPKEKRKDQRMIISCMDATLLEGITGYLQDLHPDLRIALFHARKGMATSGEKENISLMKNPNKYFENNNIDIYAYSPAGSIGISIEKDFFSHHFHISNSIVDVNIRNQATYRDRTAKKIYCCVRNNGIGKPAKTAAHITNIVKKNSGREKPELTLWEKIAISYMENELKEKAIFGVNDYVKFISNGDNVRSEYTKNNEDLVLYGKDFIRKLKKITFKNYHASVVYADDIDQETKEKLQKKLIPLRWQESVSILRLELKQYFNLTSDGIPETLIDIYDNGRFTRGVENYAILRGWTTSNKDNYEIKNGVCILQRSHEEAVVKAAAKVLTAAGYNLLDFSGYCSKTKAINAYMEFIDTKEAALLDSVRLWPDYSLTEKVAMRWIGKLLKVYGLTQVPSKRNRVYTILESTVMDKKENRLKIGSELILGFSTYKYNIESSDYQSYIENKDFSHTYLFKNICSRLSVTYSEEELSAKRAALRNLPKTDDFLISNFLYELRRLL